MSVKIYDCYLHIFCFNFRVTVNMSEVFLRYLIIVLTKTWLIMNPFMKCFVYALDVRFGCVMITIIEVSFLIRTGTSLNWSYRTGGFVRMTKYYRFLYNIWSLMLPFFELKCTRKN